MAESAYQYDESSRRYRHKESGKYLSKTQVLGLRDKFLDEQKEEVRALAAKLSAEDIDLPAWETAMRAQVKQTYLAEALLGRGGRGAMQARDWGALGRQVRSQYQFLSAFAKEIADDGMSEARISSRASLYIESATQAYERARASAYGLKLPQYPGDGKTACLVNCRCHWDIAEDSEEWRATWKLGKSEHCEGCEENADKWAPLVVAKKKD